MQDPLPLDWVEKLFSRLAVRYGSQWLMLWEGLDMAAVKADWGNELAGLQHRPEGLRYAVDNLPPDRPPNAAQFRLLTQRAPSPAKLRQLPAPNAAAAKRVRQALVGLGRPKDQRAWADRLKARHEAGEPLSVTQVAMYRAALREREHGDAFA
jgi:hypothetical protein